MIEPPAEPEAAREGMTSLRAVMPQSSLVIRPSPQIIRVPRDPEARCDWRTFRNDVY